MLDELEETNNVEEYGFYEYDKGEDHDKKYWQMVFSAEMRLRNYEKN